MLPTHIQHLYELFGEHTVLLAIPKGSKGPCLPAWQALTVEETRDPAFKITFKARPGENFPRQVNYSKLLANGNIGVLQGHLSNGICSIDVDDDDYVQPLIDANPWLNDTLQSRGGRGRNFWFRVTDPAPGTEIESFNMSNEAGKQVIEFRASGRQTLIWGVHPSGSSYTLLNEFKPTEISLTNITWPNGLTRGKKTDKIEYATESYPLPETPRLQKRRDLAGKVLKNIFWSDNISGFCQCPGEANHTGKTSSRDCMFAVNGTPTLYCFHTSCSEEIRSTNIVFRDLIRKNEELPLPNGNVGRDEIAEELFRRLAQDRTAFIYGGQIVEIDIDKNTDAPILRPLKGLEIVSRFERVAAFYRTKITKKDEIELISREPAMISAQLGAELLACRNVNSILPTIDRIQNSSILLERDGELVAAAPGYHPEKRIWVSQSTAPAEVALDEAVKSLLELISEWQFASPADKSRAIAALITPAMLWAGLIKRAPLVAYEADDSQSGKTSLALTDAGLYGERVGYVAIRKGGVGSQDESIASVLAQGRPMVLLDNLREETSSTYLEALLTSSGGFPIRIPGKAEIMIDPSQFCFSMTSNGFKMTPDLANRASVVRIRKRHGFAYRDYGDGKSIEDYARDNSSYFTGCVFAVVKHWWDQGKPSTGTVEHDFRDWAGKADWIVQNIFGAAPLLEGHRELQRKASSPCLGWIETVAALLRGQGDWEKWLKATTIADTCIHNHVEIPLQGRSEDHGVAAQAVGRAMGQIFPKDRGDVQVTSVDGGFVHCAVVPVKRSDGKGFRGIKNYFFSAKAEAPEEPEKEELHDDASNVKVTIT